MIIPEYLKKGDTIGIVSPAGSISENYIHHAVNIFESWGLNVVIGKNTLKQHFQFAGTDKERTEDFQMMLDDEKIKAIICSRGGYGSIRIIDQMDFSKFIKNPKWIVGFSDITVFHVFLNCKLKIASIHGPMPKSFNKYVHDKSLNFLKTTLFGDEIQYVINPNRLNKFGTVKSEIIGGNLNILHNLIGSQSDFHPDGKILFLEDIGEYLYNIDRMMWGLKRSGKLQNLAGLIIGQFTDVKDNEKPFGKEVHEIILDHVDNYNYPVCFDFPAGHESENYSIILGKEIKMSITGRKAFIHF